MTRIGGLREDNQLAQDLKKRMEQWLVASNLGMLENTTRKPATKPYQTTKHQ